MRRLWRRLFPWPARIQAMREHIERIEMAHDRLRRCLILLDVKVSKANELGQSHGNLCHHVYAIDDRVGVLEARGRS